MRFSVVIPLFDEVNNVHPLFTELKNSLERPGMEFEVIAVDDASRDSTAARCSQAGPMFAHFRLLRHTRRQGQSAALLTGISEARGSWIVTLDGDGQNDPADIPRLLAVRDSEQEQTPEVLVAGIRRQRNDNWRKRFSSRVANTVRSSVLGDGFPDTGCGLKLFRRVSYLDLPRFNHMHRFLPALFQRQGAEVIGVTVNHRPRQTGRSKYGVWDRLWVGLLDLMGVWWLNKRILEVEYHDDHPSNL